MLIYQAFNLVDHFFNFVRIRSYNAAQHCTDVILKGLKALTKYAHRILILYLPNQSHWWGKTESVLEEPFKQNGNVWRNDIKILGHRW